MPLQEHREVLLVDGIHANVSALCQDFNMRYEVNTTYISANLKAIKELNYLDTLVPTLSAELLALVENPRSQSWWPGELNEKLMSALAKVGGPSACESVGFVSIERSIGPIIMPLLKIVLTVTNSDPHTIFSKMNQFASVSSRGVKMEWTKRAPNRGDMSVEYPTVVDPVMESVWKGGLGCGLKLIQRVGTVEIRPSEAAGKRLLFSVQWE